MRNRLVFFYLMYSLLLCVYMSTSWSPSLTELGRQVLGEAGARALGKNLEGLLGQKRILGGNGIILPTPILICG